MADLKQRVLWSIDYSCRLRTESSSDLPRDVERCLGSVVQYERALREGGEGNELLGDILITSTRSLSDPFQLKGERRMGYPEKGWSVSRTFRRQGGAEGLFRACGKCPANVTRHRLAGCVGDLFVDPDATWINEGLAALIGQLGIASKYRQSFRVTQPLWYGLWCERELDLEAQAILLEMLSGLLDWGTTHKREGMSSDLSAGLRGLLNAIRITQSEGFRLRVELLPPGRQVLDLETFFPHCPMCRAVACDQVWQRPYPTALQTCSVCETRFSPAETAASYRTKRQGEALFDLLGSAGYRELVARYLRTHDCLPAEVEALVDEAERTLLDERTFESKLAQLRERQRCFLEQNVFFGLAQSSPPPSEVVEASDSAEAGLGEQMWFNASDFEVLLRRVVSLGVAVRYMTHSGADHAQERHVWDQIDDPLAILKSWLDDGCCSKFSALLIVPSSVMGIDEGELE